MLCDPVFDHRMVDDQFRYVVGNQFRPYFLFDIFRLISVEITQANRIFELAERTLDAPPCKIQFFDALRGEFTSGKVCNKAFIGGVR